MLVIEKESTILWAAPILPGRAEMWRRFCQTLMASRQAEHAASRKRLGICREATWFVTTTESDLAMVTMTTRSPQTQEKILSQILDSERPFDRWYRTQLQQILGPKQVRALARKQSYLLYRWQL